MELSLCDEMSVQPLRLSYMTELHSGESYGKALGAKLASRQSYMKSRGLSSKAEENPKVECSLEAKCILETE